MKTIDERAREYATHIYEFPSGGLQKETNYEEENAYVAGATEQKEIDDAEWTERCNRVHEGVIKKALAEKKHDKQAFIEKDCKWLSENLDRYVGEGGWNIWDDDPNCETYADIVARDFRKGMEE